MSNLIIIFILIFVFCTHGVCANFKVGTTPDESQSTITPKPTQNPANLISNEGGSGGNFESKEEYPSINRIISPNYKDFNLKNKVSNIEVEIQGSGRDFDNVLIREIIDKKFKNITNICVYIDNPLSLIKREVNKLNITSSTNNNIIIQKLINETKENYAFCNNDIYIKIPRLRSGENIIYNYTVVSEKSGIFNAVTLFRLNGSRWSDLEKRAIIEMRPPEIDVSAETDQSCASREDFLNVTYNILHKSGWSNDDLDVKLFFNYSDQYTIYYENKTIYANQLIDLKLKPLEITKYHIKIKYHSAGKHLFPSLDIDGATVYQKDADIDVLYWNWFKYLQDYELLISFFSVFFVLILTAYDIRHSKTLEGTIEHLQGQIDQINHFQKRRPICLDCNTLASYRSKIVESNKENNSNDYNPWFWSWRP